MELSRQGWSFGPENFLPQPCQAGAEKGIFTVPAGSPRVISGSQPGPIRISRGTPESITTGSNRRFLGVLREKDYVCDVNSNSICILLPGIRNNCSGIKQDKQMGPPSE